MEISTSKPEERVFRIDDECYIIYLGSDKDDLKPFLRIGNSQRITPYVVKGTYNIVITDSLTGNLALEPENMNRENSKENRYVGDKKITASLLKFIHQFEIENGSVSTIEDVQKAHKRAEVHFFDDGNIHILYDRNLLFDLRKREKSDLHFIERAHMLKGIHAKNPLRYRPEDLEAPGFLLLQQNIVLFEKGRATTFGIPEFYFKAFVNSGIDPDFIETIVTDDIGGSFFKLLKRKWSTRDNLRILTANSPLFKSAAALFTHTGAGTLHADITSFETGEKRTSSGFRLERNSRGFVAKHKDLPWPLLISGSSSSEQGLFKLNPDRGVMIQPGKASVPIPEGVVHNFLESVPERRELLQVYFRDILGLIEDDLNPSESIVAKLIDQLLGDMDRKATKPMLDRVRKGLKKVKFIGESGLFYLLNNVYGIISILNDTGDDESGIIQSFAPLRDSVHKKLRSLSTVRTQLPVRGDLYPTDESVAVLYGPVRGVTSRDAYAITRELVHDVDQKAASFLEELDRELARLHALLFELQGEPAGKGRRLRRKGITAGSTPGIPEGIAVPKIGGIGGGRREAGREAAAVKEPTTAEERQAYTTAPVQHVSYSRGLNGPIKFIIPTAVVVIAAIVLALFFLFPGVIGRRKPGEIEEAAVATAGDETAAEEALAQEGEGEEAFEVDEFLEEKGIPQSALTERRTVIYRGLIEITVLDIYLLTNEIAVSNGYRRLDSVTEAGRDPDWIYPGNLFVLPDSTEYTVVKGDTMWYIAHRFIIKRLEEDWERYSSIKKEVDTGTPDTQRKEVLIKDLKSIGERSYSENFSREVDATVQKL
jgi:hypothetical protein